MERTRKTWGEKWEIFTNDLCEVSLLYLEQNRRCSWHRHQTKYNLFFVVEGQLFIKMVDGTQLVKKGQIFTTRPGELHEFQTHDERATIIEVMYVEYKEEDIERIHEGGELDAS